MSFYIGLLAFIILLSSFFKFIEVTSKKDVSNIYLVIFFLTLTIIAGFRGEFVGSDTYNYKLIFNNIGTQQFDSIYFEKFPLYSLYNLIIYNLFQNFTVIKFIDALIINGILIIFIKKFSKDIFFSSILFILLYGYFNTFNITRQYISIMILLLSFKFFTENKKMYIPLFVSSVLIHSVSLIGGIYFLFFKIRWTIKNYFILFTMSVIFFLNFYRIQAFFNKLFPIYNQYTQANSNVTNFMSGGNINKLVLYIFYLIFLLLAIFIVKNNLDNNDKLFRVQIGVTLFSIVPSFLYPNSILLERSMIIFSIMYIFLIPNIIYYISFIFKEKYLFRGIIKMVLIILLFIPFYLQLNNNNGKIIPYKVEIIRSN